MRISGGRPAVTGVSEAPRTTVVAVSRESLPTATAQLSLEDVARDAFRRKFFLDAFADERDALDRSFSFLQRVREYKQLIGRRDVLQNVAEAIVTEFLRDPPPHLCVFLQSPRVTTLLQRVVAAVDSKCSTPDLFSGVEAHVNDRLEKEKFVAFLQSPQYAQLCDALRKHRELPLGEILVDPSRTRFLEQFVRQTYAAAVGNLLFWVEVQTVFLPLIQTNVVSVSLFEEIQATVRRLYNTFLTESSTVMATVVPETLRKDVLKRILQLQGEPFSPSRYATLYRPAQEKIWHWMQTTVYPKFQASMLYVALVVETENLESDRQLRKLSEHVQAAVTASSVPKASAIFVPVATIAKQRSSSHARYLRVVAPLQSEERPCAWAVTLRLPAALSESGHVRAIRVVDVTRATEDGLVEFAHTFSATDQHDNDNGDGTVGSNNDEDTRIDCMDFVWNWRHAIALPNAPSPSHRPQGTVPSPSFHCFSLPTTNGDSASTLYGYVVTSWVRPGASSESGFSDAHHSLPSQDNAADATDPPAPSMILPRFSFLLASQRLSQRCIISGLHKLAAQSRLDELQSDDLLRLFSGSDDDASTAHATPLSYRLNAAFSGFYLQRELDRVTFPLDWIFRELSHQTVVALLGALLVGKSLVIVSPRPSALVLVANALVELLRPLEWQHLFLPLCPVRTACALADRGFFTSSSSSSTSLHRGDGPQQSPFIVGLEGELVHLKTKESANEPRHRIRNSIYSVQRVNVAVRRPSLVHAHTVACQHADSSQYPVEILHTQAVVLDVDADDIYLPDRVDVPEFPQPLVRSLESALKDARLGGGFASEDSRLFRVPPAVPSFVARMLDATESPTLSPMAPVDAVRLAVLAFLESPLGDVALYFCSFRQSFASATAADLSGSTATRSRMPDHDTHLLFEADAFLDAKIELGCREFFRQLFQTEMFRQYLTRQHQRFTI